MAKTYVLEILLEQKAKICLVERTRSAMRRVEPL